MAVERRRPEDGETIAMLPGVGPVRSGRIAHGGGFWLVTYAFAVTMAFSSAPAPLYVLYQQRDGFGPFTVTLVFAAYAIGVGRACSSPVTSPTGSAAGVSCSRRS